jgi:hypothetical protein
MMREMDFTVRASRLNPAQRRVTDGAVDQLLQFEPVPVHVIEPPRVAAPTRPAYALPAELPQVGSMPYAVILILMGVADLLLIALREAGGISLPVLLSAMGTLALLAMAGCVGVAASAWRASQQIRHWREQRWQEPRQWSFE